MTSFPLTNITPATPSHLFASSYLLSHRRGLPKIGAPLPQEPSPACHFCAHTAPAQFPHYAVTKTWYPRTFSDWNRMTSLESGALCAACAYALKFGLKGFVLTSTDARHLKPSDPTWAQLLISPPEPPFALLLNCIHLKKGRLTADGAKPRHLMLSGRLAWNREHFPVTYGVHETTWIHAHHAKSLMANWRTMIQEGAAAGLWKAAQIPKILTIMCARWLDQKPALAHWPQRLRELHQALPTPLYSSRLVLEFTIRRALIAEFLTHPPITPSLPAKRRTTKKGSLR